MPRTSTRKKSSVPVDEKALVEAAVAAGEPPAPKPEREVPRVLFQHQIDKFNTIRRFVEKTPAVCDVCGLDLAAQNGLPPYVKLNKAQRAVVQELVAVHKLRFHMDEEDEDGDGREYLTEE